MQWAKNKQSGFTIVELLIVIVVIAILAAITIVAYNGIQERARQTKIDQDIATLYKAIMAARVNRSDVALRYVSNSTATGSGCWGQATGTDLATLDSTHGCWTAYRSFLTNVSNASGINVTNLVDPWGRPYYIDENEGEAAVVPARCNQDAIGYYSQPFTTGQTMTKSRFIPKILPECNT